MVRTNYPGIVIPSLNTHVSCNHFVMESGTNKAGLHKIPHPDSPGVSAFPPTVPVHSGRVPECPRTVGGTADSPGESGRACRHGALPTLPGQSGTFPTVLGQSELSIKRYAGIIGTEYKTLYYSAGPKKWPRFTASVPPPNWTTRIHRTFSSTQPCCIDATRSCRMHTEQPCHHQ